MPTTAPSSQVISDEIRPLRTENLEYATLKQAE